MFDLNFYLSKCCFNASFLVDQDGNLAEQFSSSGLESWQNKEEKWQKKSGKKFGLRSGRSGLIKKRSSCAKCVASAQLWRLLRVCYWIFFLYFVLWIFCFIFCYWIFCFNILLLYLFFLYFVLNLLIYILLLYLFFLYFVLNILIYILLLYLLLEFQQRIFFIQRISCACVCQLCFNPLMPKRYYYMIYINVLVTF